MARALELDKQIIEEELSAHATVRTGVSRLRKARHPILDSAGVVRDVEKLQFGQDSRNFEIENVYETGIVDYGASYCKVFLAFSAE